MKLTEVFAQLQYGELSQMFASTELGKELGEANYKNVLMHVNLGLTDLYKRFYLKEGQLTLEIQTGKATYELHSKYAAANTRSTEPQRYILDTSDAPFVDDIHLIERVVTEIGYEMELNNRQKTFACHTPSMNTLRIPATLANDTPDLPEYLRTTTLNVFYRANHPHISHDLGGLGLFDPSLVELELPFSHLNALLLFVASRAHNPVGMMNEFHSGNSYWAKYEAECLMLKDLNLEISTSSPADRFKQNGWV